MLRSNMIKLLVNRYAELHRGGWSEASEEERMEDLLSFIEECGMLPPSYYDQLYDDEPECNGMIHEWEIE